jgi:pilus assembly protein Flp/PilA
VTVLVTWGARFLRDEEGATAIEYTIIAAGLSIVIAVVVQSIGTSVSGMFTVVQAAFN